MPIAFNVAEQVCIVDDLYHFQPQAIQPTTLETEGFE